MRASSRIHHAGFLPRGREISYEMNQFLYIPSVFAEAVG